MLAGSVAHHRSGKQRLTIVLMVFVRRVYLRNLLSLAAVERESAEKQKRICKAVTGVTTLEFPLAVIPLSKLREQGRLVPYEEARDSGALRCCDTVESAVAFADAHPLMFVSHQWLSLRHPDPESQHYPVIIKAAEALCAMHGIDQDSMHIWLDYHSIPQENDTTKRLAIGSIALYAACSHYFLACAPEALHQDTSPPCRVDADTYLQRGWCRRVVGNRCAAVLPYFSLSSRRPLQARAVGVYGHQRGRADVPF